MTRTLLSLAALAMALSPAVPVWSQTTTIVGGSLLNGNFNADASATDQRTFATTAPWVNLGTAGQNTTATRTTVPFDGSRNAQLQDAAGVIFGLDTGYSIVDGDSFNIGYAWRDAFNWVDAFDEVAVSLFTTADNTIGGSRTVLATALSGPSSINDTWETYVRNGLYTAQPADAGKRLFVQLNGVDGNANANGFARVDNFVLTEGFIPPPVVGTPNAPSVRTGVNLFRDTFDRPSAIDIVDDVTDGISSDVFTPAVGTTYAEFRGSFGTATSEIQNNKLNLSTGRGETIVGIDRNFTDPAILAAGGFAIEAIVDPHSGGNGIGDNRFLAIAVGLSQATATTQTTVVSSTGSNADRQLLEQGAFTFTIEDDGQYNAFDSYAKVRQAQFPTNPVDVVNVDQGSQTSAPAAQTPHDRASVINDGFGLGQNDFLAQIGAAVEQDEYKVRLEFRFADFADGSNVEVTAFIEDIQIDLNPLDGIEAVPGDRDTYTFTWDGANQNYIAFEGRARSGPTTVDSLLIETLLAPLDGDFNLDGIVDAADYTVYRDNLGAPAGTLPNDPTGFAVGLPQLDLWRQNYGATRAGAANSAAVPEPIAAALALLAVVPGAFRRVRGG